MTEQDPTAVEQDAGSTDNSLLQRLNALRAPFEGPHTVGNTRRFWIGFIVVVLAALLYPLLSGVYQTILFTGFFIWIFLALSLSVIWGYGGIFSFGQTAFFGIGGYTFGVVGINLLDVTGATNLAILAGILLPALLAAILGYFMFYGRVSGVYVAIITLATTLILELLLSRTAGEKYRIGEAALGGYNGMTEIPSITLGYQSMSISFQTIKMYYLVVVLLIALYLFLRYLVNSNFGYVMVATREAEERTEMFGYDVRAVKLKIFVLGGAIGGIGGILYASSGNFISPPIMGLTFAALPVIWLTVGGRTTLLGAIIATFGLRYLNNFLAGASSEFSLIFLGIILLGVVLYFPSGLIPTIKARMENDTIPILNRFGDET